MQRKSLFKNLLQSLFTVGSIETTEAKAKAVRGIADKLVHRASVGSVVARRTVARFFGTRAMVNVLVDQVAPAMKDRNSGYTRIIRLGKRRGDDSMMVKMELVAKPLVKPEIVVTEAAQESKKSVPKKTTAKKQVKKSEGTKETI